MKLRNLLPLLATAGALSVALAQGLPPAQITPPAPVMLPPVAASMSMLNGGVTSGNAANTAIGLSLDDAIQRGLKYNLAALVSSSATEQVRAQRLSALAALLPNVSASSSQVRQKLNLAAMGISVPGVPPIVGPFNVFQASAAADIPILNISGLQNLRAGRALESAAQSDFQATRDLVVRAVANQYLLAVADSSRVDAATAQLRTADAALTQAQDMLQAGTVDGLVVVRAQVQRNRQQQQLTIAQNALATQRLQFGRAIGLPANQDFTLTTPAGFDALTLPTPEAAVASALAARPDYKAAQFAVRAAQLLVAAAHDQHLPTFGLQGSYGTLGHELDSNHPIFSVGASINLPIYAGGRTAADVMAAKARLEDAENRAADLRTAIGVEVRTALLDLQSDRDQVNVARDSRDLAQRELTLAQDRFSAGVADNLEVVQAQQTVAEAEESYIASLYAYNLAKADLAQALGVAASQYRQYLAIP